MGLFILITLLSLLSTILPDIIRNYLKVSRFFVSIKSTMLPFRPQLDEARENLETVRNAQHVGEYSRTIKIMRAEQKVKDVQSKIVLARNLASLKQTTIDTVACYASKLLLTLVLIVVSIRNRGSPVLIFDDSFSLQPLGGLLSFPTGVANAVSVPIWAFSCNCTFRLLYKLARNRV